MKTVYTILFMILLAACSKSDNEQEQEGSISATIDGVHWEATSSERAVHVLSNFGLGGDREDDQSSLTIQITGVTGTGTFDFTGGNFAQFIDETPEVFVTTPDFNGSLTIQSLTKSRATGTFSFDAKQMLTTTDRTISVRDGKFDVPISN